MLDLLGLAGVAVAAAAVVGCECNNQPRVRPIGRTKLRPESLTVQHEVAVSSAAAFRSHSNQPIMFLQHYTTVLRGHLPELRLESWILQEPSNCTAISTDREKELRIVVAGGRWSS